MLILVTSSTSQCDYKSIKQFNKTVCHIILQYKSKQNLDVHLRSSPVSSLGVVLDGVVSSQSDPLGQRSVLLLGLGHLLLGLERFLGLNIG